MESFIHDPPSRLGLLVWAIVVHLPVGVWGSQLTEIKFSAYFLNLN